MNLDQRVQDQIAKRTAVDRERDRLQAELLAIEVPEGGIPEEEREEVSAELRRRLEELGEETCDDYMMKALRFMMRYEAEREAVRRSEYHTVPETRKRKHNSQVLIGNRRKTREFLQTNTTVTEFVKHSGGRRLREIFVQYMSEVEGITLSEARRPGTNLGDVCRDCGLQMVRVDREDRIVCTQCGLTEVNIGLISTETNPPVADTSSIQSRFPYMRINHMTEAMAQLQGKETTQIPDHVLERCREQVAKRRLDPAKLTPLRVRDLLAFCKLSAYYEHCYKICQLLGGREPFQLTKAQEDRTKLMFWQLQEPFELFRPQGRSNFFSYSYVLMKLLQLQGMPPELLADFNLLKSREKLVENDLLWRKCCRHLGWTFHRTV